MNKFLSLVKSPFFIILFIAAVILLLGGLRVMFYIKSPDVLLLADRSGAQWIKCDSEIDLGAKPSSLQRCAFRYAFNVNKKIDDAVITLQALKKAEISLDGIKIFSSTHAFNQWKQIHHITLPFAIKTGSHEIIIHVTSENSYPSIIAYSDQLDIRTGYGWLASHDGKDWIKAVPVSETKQPEILKKNPSSIRSLTAILPYLTGVFLIVFILSLLMDYNAVRIQPFFKWCSEPSQVRWILIFLWAVLSVNNMFRLSFQTGYDVFEHMEYIDYIATKGSLPLFPQGWQMFHPPLNYILSAPLYAVLIQWLDLPSVVKIMGIIPVICGLLQIEIVYRAAQLVFAERKNLQIIATIAGALLPVHTYTCQYVGNEPLAACLMSLVILLCMHLIVSDQKERQYGYFMLMGFVWGLALLSKMTALLLIPVLVSTVAFHTRSAGRSLKYFLQSTMILLAVSTGVAGWYYLRNYVKLGNPFPGVFDAMQVMQWWQDPGYRLWSHLWSFGQVLIWPVYAGVTSFWDMFYSTLWLDGLNSGLMDFIPWNVNFMTAGALLALLPNLFIISGLVSIGLNKKNTYRNAVVFSTGLIVLFLLAMIDMYMVCPVYSRTKASYTLGLLPCYAILMAAGAEPFLRNKIMRSLSLALFACWAFAAYIAYFVVKFQ
jgi:hypothetical protein